MKKRLVALATIMGLFALSPFILALLAVLIAERHHLSRYEKPTREIS